jgi:chaperonin GroEL
LLYAGRALNTLKGLNHEQELGISIIRKAITLPCKTISDNAGFEGVTTIEKVNASTNFNYGFDASKGEFTDLIARGVIDPAKVVRVALEDAASVSSYMTTT